jgi:4-amino-4-deoxy-L-arabinose transferase-like glycosyltransferase
MYANAADLNRGLIPYKEIFIQYGFLTTFIQSLSLNIFGNTVVSVGIITGIFYAANIYLSYCLWRKILNRWSSALSSVVMFLVHGYVIYPWANLSTEKACAMAACKCCLTPEQTQVKSACGNASANAGQR